MPHRWNLSRWMDSLGLKRKDQPELIHAVQPVVIMGDQSAHTAPVLGPIRLAGGQRGAIAGAYSGFQLTSLAPGGTVIRYVTHSSSANYTFRFHVTASAAAVANQVAVVQHDLSPEAGLSSLVLGTYAAEPGTITLPSGYGFNIGETTIGPLYIRPGYTFQGWNSTANSLIIGHVVWEDLLAQPVTA